MISFTIPADTINALIVFTFAFLVVWIVNKIPNGKQ